MNSNEIYKKITENIIHQFQTYKKNDINARVLNENLVLNLSSLCKFINGKENLNVSSLDVYLPSTRLEYAINSKIREEKENTPASYNETEEATTFSILDDLKKEEKLDNIEKINNEDFNEFNQSEKFEQNQKIQKSQNINNRISIDYNESFLCDAFIDSEMNKGRESLMSMSISVLNQNQDHVDNLKGKEKDNGLDFDDILNQS